MSALIEKLPVTFAGPDVALLPTVTYVDPIESAGSLLLIDPTHPLQQWAAGVPASGTKVPNLLAGRAAKLTGLAATAVDADIYSSGLTGTKGLVERSSKGGLHGIISPTVATTALDALQVVLAQGIYDWIKATGYAHNFYVSLWTRRTRVAADLPAENLPFGQLASGGGFVSMFTQRTNLPNTAVSNRAPDNLAGPSFRNLASVPGTAFRDSAEGAGVGAGNHAVFSVGNRSTAGSTAARLGKSGSHVFYRAYVEDLTASGRTYAQLDALDNQLYTKEVLTAGGRYYADTFTDPATIA